MPKLLLADASPMMHRIVELTFAQKNMDVITAADGEEAIRLIPSARPDIVVADHVLPRRTGYEVAAFLKGHPDLAHIPVILLSGAFEPVDRIRAAQVGCDDVLVKPFEPRQLVARVRALLEARTDVPAGRGTAFPAMSRPAGLKLVEDPVDRETGVRGPAPPRSEGVLADYFDEFDTALEHLGGATGLSRDARVDPLPEAPHDEPHVPTLEALLRDPSREAPPAAPERSGGSVHQAPAIPETTDALPQPPRRLTDLSELADALGAFTRREPAPPAPPAPATPPVPSAAAVSEELVEEVTRRVLERLAPELEELRRRR